MAGCYFFDCRPWLRLLSNNHIYSLTDVVQPQIQSSLVNLQSPPGMAIVNGMTQHNNQHKQHKRYTRTKDQFLMQILCYKCHCCRSSYISSCLLRRCRNKARSILQNCSNNWCSVCIFMFVFLWVCLCSRQPVNNNKTYNCNALLLHFRHVFYFGLILIHCTITFLFICKYKKWIEEGKQWFCNIYQNI